MLSVLTIIRLLFFSRLPNKRKKRARRASRVLSHSIRFVRFFLFYSVNGPAFCFARAPIKRRDR